MYRTMFTLQGNSLHELAVQMHNSDRASIMPYGTHSSKFIVGDDKLTITAASMRDANSLIPNIRSSVN